VAVTPSWATYVPADWEDCRSDDFERAIAGCTRMLESQITPIDRAVALTNRSNAYRLHGDYDRAISDATDSIRIYPDYALAYANRANAYLGKGDTDNAIKDANAVIHGAPTYPGGTRRRLQGERGF
jgi:tetratricopeptide (TPR) repeat protein